MGRDMRVRDNWALLAAADLAARNQAPLRVLYVLPVTFLGATWRHYDFLLRGLEEVERRLRERGIGFQLELGLPDQVVPEAVARAGAVVCDTNPLRIVEQWKEGIAKSLPIPMYEVDAHNVVPWWVASSKPEFGAYTLRPKLLNLLPTYLAEFPEVPTLDSDPLPVVDWVAIRAQVQADTSVGPVQQVPGEQAGLEALRTFLQRIDRYEEDRNNPNLDGQSGLSPWLHMGHISAQRVLLELGASPGSESAKTAFRNEVLVWRELAENFCAYNPRYDSFDGAHDWAKTSLNQHRSDPREATYTYDQFAAGATHDDLWNAAQHQMVRSGKMHGYLRMYWAKQILAWTPSPEEALAIANRLNDRYSIDGNDPNGYAGTAWSILGTHDRAWFERPVFGKVRYMNRNGCARKFDVAAYVAANLEKSA